MSAIGRFTPSAFAVKTPAVIVSAAAIAARMVFVFILVTFLGFVEDWVCETLAVVRLLSCAEEQQAYDNKMYAASFPMPFPASTMASFAIYHSMSLIA
jgi:hypothetical protein